MDKPTVGFAMCGSFCTIKKALEQMEFLSKKGFDIIPIMSYNVYSTDTRFGKANEHIKKAEEISGHKVISTLTQAEPIGPSKKLDLLIIEPCTGNTVAKLANGITDTPVTLAAKAHLRNNRPVLIAVSSNDALSTSALNIGKLLNTKNIFFIPMRQDDSERKPRSVVADFEKTYEAALSALENKQIQPILL